MQYWHALYTRPRHEKKLFEELKNRNIEAFLPTYRLRRRWTDRFRIVEEPLLRNYLFVRVPPERYRDALLPYGALSLVMCNGLPAPIPEDEIEAIRRLVASGLPYNPYPYLTVGRRVSVVSGPLRGCEGVLTRRKGVTRLVLSIHILQQSVVAEVDAECVAPG
jgi:transcription antitermination factor NusG